MLTPLKAERMRKGIKQWRMSSILGISQAEYSNYENARRHCPTDMRYRLEKILECPVDTLFPEERS